MSNPLIFISYRRDDSAAGHAQHLWRDLTNHFGIEAIFMDIGSIAPGAEWLVEIHKALSSCKVLLAIIGRQWLTIADSSSGRRRLDDPHDFVRIEILEALERSVVVIPVRMHGAKLPRPGDLPDELRPLVEHQEHEVTDNRWDYDVGELIKRLDVLLADGASSTESLIPSRNTAPSLLSLRGAIAGVSAEASSVLRYIVLSCEPEDYISYDQLAQALKYDKQQLDDALHELKDQRLVEPLAELGLPFALLKPHIRAWDVAGDHIVGFSVLANMLSVASIACQESPVNGSQLHEIIGLPPKQINVAVLLMEYYGRLNVLKVFGTTPYLFAEIEANYKTRQWLRAYQPHQQ